MFDLDKAITDWRRQMLAAGIKTPVPLDELENHLRDDIEQQVRSGTGELRAFEAAVQRIGHGDSLRSEFKKASEPFERNHMKRRLIIGVGVVGLLLGTAMILPALGKHKERNLAALYKERNLAALYKERNLAALSAGERYFSIQWTSDEVYGLVWGISLAAGGLGTALFGMKKRTA